MHHLQSLYPPDHRQQPTKASFFLCRAATPQHSGSNSPANSHSRPMSTVLASYRDFESSTMFEDDDDDDKPALPPGHMVDAEEIESTTTQPRAGTMRSRALATQAKLDQLEKQREQAAKAKAKKAGLLTKTDGPAAEERKGLRMVEDSSSEEDEESKPEPSKKAGAPISTGGAAGFSLDRGAAVTALSTNRKTVGSSNAEKKLQMLGLSTEVDHSEPGGGGKKSKGRPVITEGESDDDEESGAVAVSPAAAGARGQESDEEEETNVVQSIDVSDIKSFVLMTIPRSQTAPVQCYIKRCRSGLQKLWPYYVLYSQDPDKFLLAGRRRKKNKQSTYLISTSEKELTRKSSCYIGKVKSNFVGTEFTMYDSGANPSDNKEGNEIRTELGVVQYDRNVLGTNGPRKMQVYLPSTDRSGVRDKLQPTQTSDCMTKKIENKDHNYIKIVNKTPRWNENLGAFCLNFQGRVTVASVKNFQLVDENDQDKIVLQFGKCSDDTFTMDYCYPMCALQAFAICMSSFDHKLACE